MTNVLPLYKWLDVVASEYLNGFIRDGGSSIKFAVPTKPGLDTKVVSEIKDIGTRLNYLVVQVNASDTRVHLPQEIFFKVAAQINWRLFARRVILRLAQEPGYKVDGIEPDSAAPILSTIGQTNGLDEGFMRQILSRGLQDAVFRNKKLAKDFRVAMTHLCLMEMTSSEGGYGGTALIDWLTGTNRKVSNVKHFTIYNNINRTNARYFLESLLHWVKYVGFAGLTIIINTSRVTLLQNPRDGLIFYSRPAVIDHYELLREFIDGTDRLQSCLMVVVTNTDFLDETSAKGFGIYPALMGRVIDEVRDRNLVNPMSSLIRLTEDDNLEE